MATTTSTDLVSYYRADVETGVPSRPFMAAFEDDELADIAKRHNNDSGAPGATIASSSGANFMLVPGPKGIAKFLHYGFLTTTHLLGEAMIFCFIQGNFSFLPSKAICCPNETVQAINQGRPMIRGKDTAPTACPTLVALFGATSEDELSALPGDQEDTLTNRPNHLSIHPAMIFTKANGPRTIKAKALAYATGARSAFSKALKREGAAGS